MRNSTVLLSTTRIGSEFNRSMTKHSSGKGISKSWERRNLPGKARFKTMVTQSRWSIRPLKRLRKKLKLTSLRNRRSLVTTRKVMWRFRISTSLLRIPKVRFVRELTRTERSGHRKCTIPTDISKVQRAKIVMMLTASSDPILSPKTFSWLTSLTKMAILMSTRRCSVSIPQRRLGRLISPIMRKVGQVLETSPK